MTQDGDKPTFSPARLPVSPRYVRPASRRRFMAMGVVAAAVVLALLAGDWFVLGKRLVSAGDVSSHHAAFESNCDACHSPYAGVSAANCSGCHEVEGQAGRVYTFSAHYLYTSTDAGRMRAGKERAGHMETACHDCHDEHRGRTADITRVGDDRCAGCHGFGGFEGGHPEFAHVTENRPDAASLSFTHFKHIQEYFPSYRKPTGNDACTLCHIPETHGRHFAAVSFDKSCSGRGCHLYRDGAPAHGDLRALSQPKNECVKCHAQNGRDIERVVYEQGVFQLANFSHAPHVVGTQCVDCHNAQPMYEGETAGTAPDAAATLNIPGKQNCVGCHTGSGAQSTCDTCHDFHPNKDYRFRLTAGE